MSYTKQTFIDNETVLTAEHLNHIEDGIDGCVRYDCEQNLSEDEKTKARENIGAASADDITNKMSSGITLTDRTTGKKYEVYVDNGKLTMAESEG